MQDYTEIAAKNGVALTNEGACQFCGARTKQGIQECMEIFNLGFQGVDFTKPENHIYRFLIVDAHTLQHPEIHGRWSNHFHLSRLHLIYKYDVKWTYRLSPKLSDYLNKYKVNRQDEYLNNPPQLKRGSITSADVQKASANAPKCKILIKNWAMEVYGAWDANHDIIDNIAIGFLNENAKNV